MTEEELINEIEKPVVTFMAIENTSATSIVHCYFKVQVSFKLVDGVKPYPDFEYNSIKYSIADAEAKGDELLEKLAVNVESHKLKYDTIKMKQDLITSFLDLKWGA